MVVLTPAATTDAYGNPVPHLDYGPTVPRRTVWCLLQPAGSTEPAQRGRQPIITSWRLSTYSQIGGYVRALWQGRTFEVDGQPDQWSPRFGRTHFETRLRRVEG